MRREDRRDLDLSNMSDEILLRDLYINTQVRLVDIDEHAADYQAAIEAELRKRGFSNADILIKANASPGTRGRQTAEEIEAHRRGTEDCAKGHARKAVPGEFRDPDKAALANAWLKGYDGEAL